MIKILHPHTVEAFLTIAGVSNANIATIKRQMLNGEGVTACTMYKQQATDMCHVVGKTIAKVEFEDGSFIEFEADI